MDNNLNELMNEFIEWKIGSIKKDEPLAGHTTIKIGGPADLFIEPSSLRIWKKQWNWFGNIKLIGEQ